jgi:hypothetical protein
MDYQTTCSARLTLPSLTHPSCARADPPKAFSIDALRRNEATNRKVELTLRRLFHAGSKLVLLTSTSVAHLLPKIYDEPPVGPLVETGVRVEHASGISNAFGVWCNWEPGLSLE